MNSPRMQLKQLHEIVVLTQRMPLSMGRTRIVNFLPRYVLVNETDVDLQVGQRSIDLWLTIPKRETDGTTDPIAWHWPSANHRLKMVVKAVAPKIAAAAQGRRGSVGPGARLSCAGGRLSCVAGPNAGGGRELPGPKYSREVLGVQRVPSPMLALEHTSFS